MGIAAYNRGTQKLRNDFEREMPTPDQILLRDLTALSVETPRRRLFGATVIRFDQHGLPWLMHRQRKGWGEFGLPYPSLWVIARTFNLSFTGLGCDEHGRYIAVRPSEPIGEQP